MSRWRPPELWAIFYRAPRVQSKIFHADCWRCIFENVLLNIRIAQRGQINRIMAMSRGRTRRMAHPTALAAFGTVSSIDMFYNVRVPRTEWKKPHTGKTISRLSFEARYAVEHDRGENRIFASPNKERERKQEAYESFSSGVVKYYL